MNNLTDFNDLHKMAGPDAVKRCIDAAAVRDTADDWPELQPLIAQIDAQDYPIDALPAAVRGAVLEVAGFVKAPIPLIASSAVAALSLAIQAHVDVQRADKLHGPCGLFILVIADSGERKSTCDGFFTRAIRDYEAREQEASKPLIVPLRDTPPGQRLRGSMSTSMPRKKSRAAISLSVEGASPGNGKCPVHTEQRPHGAGEGSSSAVCKYAIRQPAPCAYWRMMPASCWRTWASAAHLAVSCT